MAKFYGIGVGPGDPDLLTIKAAKILGDIDVLILPESQKGRTNIAYEIARKHINPGAEIISMEFPMVTDVAVINQAGKEAAVVVEKYIASGKNVAFITLGDPSVYSTFGYIIKNLGAEVEIETIPGITSFCAAAATVNKPLVEGDEILSIIPATAPEKVIETAMNATKSLVFMKVYNQKDKVLKLLDEHQMTDHSLLVRKVGFEDCSVDQNIKTALEEGKQYLSIILSRKEQ